MEPILVEDLKEGDSVLFEFTTCVITRLDEIGVEVSDELGSTSMSKTTAANRFWKITEETQMIAKHFEYYYGELRKLHRNLNFPDIHAVLDKKFNEACKYSENNVTLGVIYDGVRKFIKDIKTCVNTAVCHGIKVFRP